MRSMEPGPAKTGPRKDLQTIRTLLPYLWPKGEAELRLRVVCAMALLALAKVCGEGHDFGAELGLQPFQDDRSVEAAGIGEDDFLRRGLRGHGRAPSRAGRVDGAHHIHVRFRCKLDLEKVC